MNGFTQTIWKHPGTQPRGIKWFRCVICLQEWEPGTPENHSPECEVGIHTLDAEKLAAALRSVLDWYTNPDSLKDCETDVRLRIQRELDLARADKVLQNYTEMKEGS